jgi:uncharacterized damage-inducible protein DinB
MSISSILLPEFEHEMANTRKILERVPEDKVNWKPHEKSMTLGRLAGHVAALSNWAVHTLKLPSLDIKPREDGSYESLTMTSRQQVLEEFDRSVAEAKAALQGASDEDMAQVWTLSSQGKTFLSMPRAAVLRNVVMNHMIHHRGQLSVYLRLNDVPVPGMYGPSGDEPRAF